MTTEQIAQAIAQAIDGHDGFRATRDDAVVRLSRSRRDGGTIEVTEDHDGRVDLDLHIRIAQGGVNALLRDAGICDSHWDLI